MSIKILRPDVVNKIAAGEVLERPANLLKEMVENSLDAGATSIEIDVDLGGRSLSVRDNGRGISRADLPLVFARHATSKISESDDLWQLESFGFRGEAMASLAAVSKTTLTSRIVGSTMAARITTEFGTLGPTEEVGGEEGTVFHVRDLFENVPARLKFLKSDSAEITQIKKTLRALSLAHTDVDIKFRESGRLTLHLPRVTTLDSRVRAVLGFDKVYLTSKLGKTSDYGVEIAFTSPNDTFGTSQNIWFFAQGRWIQDRSLQAAVMEAYRNLLMHGEYPLVVAKIQCPPDEIDVNIHPAKSHVKFRDPQAIFRLVHHTLREALEKAPWIAEKRDELIQTGFLASQSYEFRVAAANVTTNVTTNLSATVSETASGRSTKSGDAHMTVGHSSGTEHVPHAQSNSQLRFESDAGLERTFHRKKNDPSKVSVEPEQPTQFSAPIVEGIHYWSLLDVLGQTTLTYILAQSAKALILIDQHAAHERVLFEKIMNGWRAGRIEVQNYLLPLTLKLEADHAAGLLTYQDELTKLGVTLESLGPETIVVQSGPAFISDGGLINALDKMAREIAQHGGGFAFERALSNLAATMACHSAVRAGQSLSPVEMKELLQQMDEHPLSSFCPHGRPVYVEWSFRELDRDFGRLG